MPLHHHHRLHHPQRHEYRSNPERHKERTTTSASFPVSQVWFKGRGATCEVAPSAAAPSKTLVPASMGRTPEEQLRRRAVAPHESFSTGRLRRGETQLSAR
ncbi:hypothetical protein EYF80_040473 [Liparis tanakae]|uniref:Uncharacterized protein n=1 Tax=Liparis tanakae TaxID=230148 RepID=A0A4Z2G6W9_9TELE|nr:hypothetical protein EYF80_040473 [Liparis tanakae]